MTAGRDRLPLDPKEPPNGDGRDIPPDAGKRAVIASNGEVHGSGAGAGGGNAGEGYDDGTPSA